ncbi:hypothetical protein EV426DRAFT_713384 [Tirmania nivea]|nr:hypothetical protein EV426DRAFT_713384 [Tirmania nivea]
MRAYTTTFLLTLIILLTTTLTSASPGPVDRRSELATPHAPQAFAEEFDLVEREQNIYPRGRKGGSGGSSDANVKRVNGLGFVVGGAAVGSSCNWWSLAIASDVE